MFHLWPSSSSVQTQRRDKNRFLYSVCWHKQILTLQDETGFSFMLKQLLSNTHNQSDTNLKGQSAFVSDGGASCTIWMAVVTTRKAQGLPLATLSFVSKSVLYNQPICIIPVQSHLCYDFDIPALLQHVTATVHCVTAAIKHV